MSKYSFDEHIFDEIDTEEKAYWIGFIWCDGCVTYRVRNKHGEEYAFKLDLMYSDVEHIGKLKEFLKSTHPIKHYKYEKGSYKDNNEMARLYICNKYFGSILYNKYGIKPNRTDFSKLKNAIPKHLFKHFIRGCIDADGSLYESYVNDSRSGLRHRIGMHLTSNTEIVQAIQEFLYEEGLLKSINKTSKRHEDRDGDCVSVTWCGEVQNKRIAEYLYEDANVYLERKYRIYKDIFKQF